MRVYTRYRAGRRRSRWKGAVYGLLAAAGLAVVAWILLRTASQAPPTSPGRSDATERTRERRSPPQVRTNETSLPASEATSETAAVTNVPPPEPPTNVVAAVEALPGVQRPVANVLEAQIALAGLGISCGPLDGLAGSQTRAALRTYQRVARLPQTGVLDAATRSRLTIPGASIGEYTITTEDLARLTSIPSTWLGKSQRSRLDFESVLELVAERYRAHPRLIQQLNPGRDWSSLKPGTVLKVPVTPTPDARGPAAYLRIRLREKTLEVFDHADQLLAHFPCSIARKVEKRPVGALQVVHIINDPNYTFNPDVFPESAEGRRLARKLVLPPGPNNPVGVAWIGLNRPGYGIHGTPHPEDVGRTESHGCFRLANWDAEYLARLVKPGTAVYVEP